MGRSRQGFSVNSNGFPCSIFERGEVCALLKWPTPSSVSGDFLPNYCVVGSITASGVDCIHARPCQGFEAANSSP
jgi:hypothetical protein